MMETVAIIQARNGSVRFPRKMLAELGGHRIIEWVVTRTLKASLIDKVALVTSTAPENDSLTEIAKEFELYVIRGDEDDVLSRFLTAADSIKAKNYVRICADNPFICPQEIDRLVAFHIQESCDYSFNHIPKSGNSYPDGFGAEVLTYKTLLKIGDQTRGFRRWREHATLFIWDNIHKFKIGTLNAPDYIGFPEFKFDVDTIEDLRYLRSLVAEGINIESPSKTIIEVAKSLKERYAKKELQ